jgi:hypothetical protein
MVAMGDRRYANMILVRKPEGKRTPGKPRLEGMMIQICVA